MDKIPLPRHDFVLVRRVPRDTLRGIAVPQISRQGSVYYVEAVGPKVENLRVGQEVIFIGAKHQEFVPMPWDENLLLMKESNVCVILEDRGGSAEGEQD